MGDMGSGLRLLVPESVAPPSAPPPDLPMAPPPRFEGSADPIYVPDALVDGDPWDWGGGFGETGNRRIPWGWVCCDGSSALFYGPQPPSPFEMNESACYGQPMPGSDECNGDVLGLVRIECCDGKVHWVRPGTRYEEVCRCKATGEAQQAPGSSECCPDGSVLVRAWDDRFGAARSLRDRLGDITTGDRAYCGPDITDTWEDMAYDLLTSYVNNHNAIRDAQLDLHPGVPLALTTGYTLAARALAFPYGPADFKLFARTDKCPSLPGPCQCTLRFYGACIDNSIPGNILFGMGATGAGLLLAASGSGPVTPVQEQAVRAAVLLASSSSNMRSFGELDPPEDRAAVDLVV
jgi:hypothetical protein